MMTIVIKINGRPIAIAKARNVSDLAAVSDYDVQVLTDPDPDPAVVPRLSSFSVARHLRAAGPWELARRIAEAIVTSEDA